MPATGSRPTPHYIGRFAPSPSGPLHLGSLLAALASYLDAAAHQGTWLLRIEDIDPPREIAGASQAIIQSLQQHGLHWQGDIIWQSKHSENFDQALNQLRLQGDLFECSCSRRQLAPFHGIHQLSCIAPPQPGNAALRLKVADRHIHFVDRLQGSQSENLRRAGGDPILRRRDGLYAYHLAAVVDDMHSGITDIVRGIDLLDATPTQLYLQERLGAPAPRYLHIPVLAGQVGEKLSKQRGAPAIDDAQPSDNLRRCLAYLGQTPPPAELQQPTDILNWAAQRWQPDAIPQQQEILVP